VQVVSRWPAPAGIGADPGGRKHELPAPVRRGLRILPVERERKHDATETSTKVRIVLTPDGGQVRHQALLCHRGQHGCPVLLPFASANNDLIAREVEIFDAKFQTLVQPQPGAIE
jgi:hypothetical protein